MPIYTTNSKPLMVMCMSEIEFFFMTLAIPEQQASSEDIASGVSEQQG